jgi:hypothetical protein
MIRFELPLHMAPTLNEYARMHWSKRRKLKSDVLFAILSQIGRRRETFSHRIKIVSTRYSSKQPDSDNPSSKIWLDCLKPDGACLIVDDSPKYIYLIELWVYAPPSKGRVDVTVWDTEKWNSPWDEWREDGREKTTPARATTRTTSRARRGMEVLADRGVHGSPASSGTGRSPRSVELPREAPSGARARRNRPATRRR